MSTLEDLVGLLSLPPKQLAHVHADVWTSQLPRAALSAAAHAASFSKATAGTAATAADAMHSNAQAAQAALARLVRQLNALLQAKSAFSQSLAIFLVGRLATAAADTSLSSSCPAWFQATLNVALRVKDEATLANAFTTLSELVPLSKHNPELRKVLQSSIKRLMDLIADALIHSKTSILHVANLLTSLSVYYAPTPATKREAFATIMVQQLLDLSRRPDKLHLKAVTRCLRAMLSGLDNRSVESGTPFAAMQTRLIGTLAFLLNGMQPSDKDTGDASRNDVETLRFDEHYGAILFPGADPSIMSLAAYVTAFERVAIVLRHLISAYAPGYRFELEVSRLLAIFDRAYEAIENANAWNGLAKLVPGSSCILANVCNDLLLVCLTVVPLSEAPKHMQTLRRKAIVTSPGPARVSAYRLAEFAIQHNVMSAADMTVVARLAAQDAGQWLDMCSRNQETLPSAASTTTRKRKLAQHSGSLIGFIDPSVEIQGRACLAGLQAIATPNASVADEGSITELISVWLRIGSMESIDEHAFGFAVKIQVQLIKTLSSILAAGEPRLLSRFFPLVAKLIAHSLHHPESEVREASAAAMNAFRRLLHPIVPPMVSSAVRAVVSSSSVGLNGLVTGDATSVFATQDGRNVHSLSASGWVPDTQPHLALSSSGPGKDPVSWTRTPTDAKATRENSHAANAKTDVSAGVKPAPQPLSTSVDVSPRTVSTLGLAANAPTAAEHAAAIHASKDDHVVGAMDHTAIPSTHAIGDLRASELEDGSSQADVDMDGADSDSAESFPSIQMDDEDDDDEE